MGKRICLLLIVAGSQLLFSQARTLAKYYVGASYGTSYSLGDFKSTDVKNPDAGFANAGVKIDLYGGFLISEKGTLTLTLRYQNFDTDIGSVIAKLNEQSPGVNFTGATEDWRVYYLLGGATYKINISRKFKLFPRFGIGPMVVRNPGIITNSENAVITQSFSRSSETGLGVGYEVGIGLQTDLGERFSLMPTFTFGGGFATLPEVVTTTDNLVTTSNYQPKIKSFNLGLSLAYRFY